MIFRVVWDGDIPHLVYLANVRDFPRPIADLIDWERECDEAKRKMPSVQTLGAGHQS